MTKTLAGRRSSGLERVDSFSWMYIEGLAAHSGLFYGAIKGIESQNKKEHENNSDDNGSDGILRPNRVATEHRKSNGVKCVPNEGPSVVQNTE